jgi:CubicO group peptidase (beta-lactamase class C family)
MKKTIFSFSLLLFVFNIYAQTVPGFVKDSLDNYVNTALQQWNIPGVAVCVVKDGKIIVMKGYGVTETGGTDKVDENTLFMIGSNTKAFTATILAMLDAEKKLSLDDKATKWLPEFKMKDPWVTKEVTVRDLLCHRLGMMTFQGDFMFFDTKISSLDILEKFSRLTPVYSFRSTWGYTNAAFLAGGLIAANATQSTWQDLVRTKIFQPLGMSRSLALSAEIINATNKAAAHSMDGNHQIIKIPYGQLDNLAPAGSISSSVNDLSKWAMMLLNNGNYQGKQVIPAAAIQQTRIPNSIIGDGRTAFNSGHFSLYGLGWMLQEYGGKKIVSHTGGVNGFVTSVTLIPEEKLGIVVLTNTDANAFYEALKWEIMDAYFGFPYRGYSKLYYSNFERQLKAQDEITKKRRDTIAMHLPLSVPMKKLTGE